MLSTLRRNGKSTLKYLGETEVHTYAFSVAANAILSFFPAAVLMYTLSRKVFHSSAMATAVERMLLEYLPSNQGFIIKHVEAISTSHPIQIFSLIMLFISCTGVFEPLEVALNSVWGFKGRNYLMNQVISLGLALGCGLLLLLSVMASAGIWAPAAAAQGWVGEQTGNGWFFSLVSHLNMTVQFVALKIIGMAASILVFFLIYWLLPNGKLSYKAVLPSAIIVGVVWEFAKLIFVLLLKYLAFEDTYGPFAVSVTLIFYAFVTGMLMLGGAHLSAGDQKKSLMVKVEDNAPVVEAAKS